MISPSLHPDSVSATCSPRGRFAFGLTPRTIWLLAAGLLLALLGFFDARLAYGMLLWDALVLLAALLDGLRLPSPQQISVERSWSNAPALDSQTEIELAVEHNAETILDCRLIDDLPAALVAEPATQTSARLPSPWRRAALQNRAARTRRCSYGSGLSPLRVPACSCRAVGDGPARTDDPSISGAAPGRGPANVPGARAADRAATSPGARTWARPRLREPARVSRRRRPARRVLDGHRAARPIDYAALPDRAQPAGVDRARCGKTAPGPDTERQQRCRVWPLQARLRVLHGRGDGATGVCFRATGLACWFMGSICSNAYCPAAVRRICGRSWNRWRRRAPKPARPITCAPRPR